MEKHYKGKNCIVTGGAGFIGQNIVNKLISFGARVVVIDNLTYGAVAKNINKKAVFVKGDVRNPEIFKRIPNRKYDFLFHFAAPSSNVLFRENLTESIDITITGFLNTIRYALKNKVRYVYPSTGSLYNGVRPPHTEKAVLNPDAQNEYAKTKIVLEQITSILGSSVNAIGLRILAGYGPGEHHKGRFHGVVYGFCQAMSKGKKPVIWGDGEQRRDFVFINDIVDVTLTLAVNCRERIVNIGTGTDINFKEVVSLINKYLPKKIIPTYGKKPKVYLERTTADTKLLRRYYKKPFTSIEDGIVETLKSL